MTMKMNITATEHGVVRLFAIETARAFDIDALAEALGVENLDPKHVDLITLSDLDELGLAGYLTLGMGIPADEVAQMEPQINALKGDVALIRSAAFGGVAVTVAPKAPLRWIASFGETPLDTTSRYIETAAAQGTISSPAPAQNRSNATVLLWVLAAFFAMLALTLSMFVRIAT